MSPSRQLDVSAVALVEVPPGFCGRRGDAGPAARKPFSLTKRELALASFALLVLAVIVFGSHIRHGGFYYDDWANAALNVHAFSTI